MRCFAFAIMLGVSVVSHAQDTTRDTAQNAQNPETLTERSQAAARAVLDRAVETFGGAASLRAISAVRYRSEGQTWDRLQMPTVLPPFEAGMQDETVLLDLVNERMRIDQQESRAGSEFRATVVLAAGSAVNYNHRTRAVVPTSSPQFVARYRRLPQLLLRQALANATTLRHLGREDISGKPHEVITFVTPRAEQVSLYLDAASNLLAKTELLYLDPLSGDEAAEILFSDYVRVRNHLVPQTRIDREANGMTGRFRMQTEINPAVSDASFEVPHEGYARVVATPPLKEQVEQLADGLFVMRHIAGTNQHSLAVAFKDHILVVEAPGSSEGADKLIARIKETIPGKPIRYIAVTHHHGDHVGGLRSFIAEGATVITTQGNGEFVEQMARAPHFDRLAQQPRKPKVEIITRGKRVLGDGTRTVELIDVGPNPHAREMVIAYLPRERILFQADLFIMPYTARPLGPVREQTRSFAERIGALGLEVDRIVGVHGLTATSEEFAELTQIRL